MESTVEIWDWARFVSRAGPFFFFFFFFLIMQMLTDWRWLPCSHLQWKLLHVKGFERGRWKKKFAPTATNKERGEEAPMPRTVRGLPQTERHFCRCYACGWSCWFGASDWTCWSKPVRAICGGGCCFGARSTPVRAIWTAESFPSTLSFSWLNEVLFVHACSWLVQRDPGMSQILVVLSPPSLEPLTLPFYCSPVPVLKNRLNSRSEVMILSRARDVLQTPADTRFQWKGQGRGLKNTHKSHFAFPRLPEVVKIKGMHGIPDRTAWTSPSHGEKKRKVLLPEQAWRPQTITAELDSSLPRHWTRLERSWRTVGQPKPCETSTRAVARRALVAESGKKGRARGSEADLAQCGALALPPPFLFFVAVGANFFFNAPLFWRVCQNILFPYLIKSPERVQKIFPQRTSQGIDLLRPNVFVDAVVLDSTTCARRRSGTKKMAWQHEKRPEKPGYKGAQQRRSWRIRQFRSVHQRFTLNFKCNVILYGHERMSSFRTNFAGCYVFPCAVM